MEPFIVEETAEVLGRMLHGLYAARHAPTILSSPTLDEIYANVKIHRKYKIDVTLYDANAKLHTALAQDPFAGLAYASQKNDLELGRQAIRLIQFKTDSSNYCDLWEMMRNVKPTWQLALAKLLLPIYAFRQRDSASDDHYRKGAMIVDVYHNVDLNQIALTFEPEWVHIHVLRHG